MSRVLVAMSGGIDSTVSALLLKRQGFDVHGVIMKNWDHGEEGSNCSFEKDSRDVNWVCQKIGINYSVIDFTTQYWNYVFQPYLTSLNHGYTPNADVLCNKYIKFHFLLKELSRFSADYLATGHYARTDGIRLFRGRDTCKDQSYFISITDPLVFSKLIFPVGNMLKSHVQQLGREADLFPILARKESMGLCFVGKRNNFQQFLSQYIPYNPGEIISLEGAYVGKHIGYQFYTIGQRCRLHGQPKGMYVAAKDAVNNRIYVVDDSNHPTLFSNSFTVELPTWSIGKFPFLCSVKTRYLSGLTYCILKRVEENSVRVQCLFESIRAITPGQIAVFYLGNICLGGAAILSREIENCPSSITDTFINSEENVRSIHLN